jgi:hypothetical protein
MLSPEMTLDELVRDLKESGNPQDPDYIPIAKVRKMMAEAIRITERLVQIRDGLESVSPGESIKAKEAIERALWHLD